MVVDRDREHTLGVFLADHVIVEHLADLAGRRHAISRLHQVCLVLLTDYVHAEFDAFIADEHGGPGDELAHLMLGFATERAVESVLRIGRLAHAYSCPGLAWSQGSTLPPVSGAGQGLRQYSPAKGEISSQLMDMPPSTARGRGRRTQPRVASSSVGRFSTTSSTRPKSRLSSADI